MTQAFPSPATQKPNGTLVSDRIDGMTYRQWLAGKILEGAAPVLAQLSREDFDLLRSRCIELAESLSPE